MQPDKLSEAKINCARYWRFARDFIFSIKTVPVLGLGTMAVDKRLRLLYDPDYIRYSTVREIQSCILHELCHIMMKHHARLANVIDNPTHVHYHAWNIAADLSVNFLLDEEFCSSQNRTYNFRVGSDWLLPGRGEYNSFEGNQSTEQYFRQVIQEQSHDQESDDDNGTDRQSDTGKDSGSSAGFQREDNSMSDEHRQHDGQGRSAGADERQAEQTGRSNGSPDQPDSSDQRGDSERTPDDGRTAEPDPAGQLLQNEHGQLQWHGDPLKKPGTGGTHFLTSLEDERMLPEGLDDSELDSMIINASHKMQSIGTKNHSHDLGELVRNISPITLDPWLYVIKKVSGKLNNAKAGGRSKRSYRRLSRRSIGSGVCRPVYRGNKPNLSICIDTSGSMSNRDYEVAFDMISKLCKRFGNNERINIIAGDTEAKELTVLHGNAKEEEIRDLKLTGGGGTDVGVLIKKASELYKPDVIVAITDGVTPWPDKGYKQPYVAVITQAKKDLERWGDSYTPDHVDLIFV